MRVGVVFSFGADKTDGVSEALKVLNEQQGWADFSAKLRSTTDLTDADSSSSLSVLVARLFRILFTKRSPKRGLAFLTYVAAAINGPTLCLALPLLAGNCTRS